MEISKKTKDDLENIQITIIFMFLFAFVVAWGMGLIVSLFSMFLMAAIVGSFIFINIKLFGSFIGIYNITNKTGDQMKIEPTPEPPYIKDKARKALEKDIYNALRWRGTSVWKELQEEFNKIMHEQDNKRMEDTRGM